MSNFSSIEKELVDYVNPDIGGIGHLLRATMPVVSVPHGMLQVCPVFTPGITDRYLADRIYGFGFSGFSIMAAYGAFDPKNISSDYSSLFDHDIEITSPHYYSVLLEDIDILFEYTATHRAMLSRITYDCSNDSNVIIGFNKQCSAEIIDCKTVKCISKYDGINSFIYLQFSKPFESHNIYDGHIVLRFSTNSRESIQVKTGLSYISCEQAASNLKNEIESWDFDAVKDNNRNIWNRTLNKVRVTGSSEKERVIFYSALYRTLLKPCDISEYGRYFSGFDKKVHDAEGQGFYVADGTWDSYRTQHPLQLILEPERQNDVISSFIRMSDQCGWLPRFPYPEGDRPVMIGNHGASVIADAYLKGFTDFDAERALEAMAKTARELTKLPWKNGPATELDKVYLEKGYFPALARDQKEWVSEVHTYEKRQSVAVTLDNCYDDWCIAQMAKKLNKMDLYEYFIRLAYNYRNVFNPETGFMSPKTADGEWVEDFNPKLDGGQGGRDYFAECNSWVFSFHVQHDVQGLINLMGGREKFAKRLDSLFTEQYDVPKFVFLKQFPDATGLIGQFCQGNEPAFHIPYLYNYSGEPWKTQRKVREIMNIWYGDGPLGICGDEDEGAMTAWYVFSAMGFYPVCPGSPTYNIGSPLFNEIVIDVGHDKSFVIKAENASSKNKYIQSAELNGKPLNKPWFLHSDIADGGCLTLCLGDRPNKEWGSRPEAAPPSMSAQRV